MIVVQKDVQNNIAYTQNAVLQKIIAMQLVKLIDCKPNQVSSILDIGCGTGFIAQTLIEKGFSHEKILQIDINPSSLQTAQQFSQTQIVDFNTKLNLTRKFDLITSSMSLQWAENLCDTLASIKSLLSPNGTFVFALPLSGSLQELYSAIDLQPLNFPKLEEIGAKFLKQKAYYENGFTTLKNIHLCDLKLNTEANLNKEAVKKLKVMSTHWNIGWHQMVNG